MRNCFLLLVLILCGRTVVNGQVPVVISNADQVVSINKNKIQYLEDKNHSFSIEAVQAMKFQESPSQVPNFFITASAYWVKFIISNRSNATKLLVNLKHPTIDNATLYYKRDSSQLFDSVTISEGKPFQNRLHYYQTYLFDIKINKGETKTFYFKVDASEQLLIPIEVGTTKTIYESLTNNDLIFGLYVGLILAMAIYNGFLFFSTRDGSYFFYVMYILFVGMTQAVLQGYTFRFLWPNVPVLNNYAAVLVPFLNGIAALEFIRSFLGLKQVSPRFNKGINGLELFYCTSLIFCVMGTLRPAQVLVQGAAFLGAMYVLWIASTLTIKGVKEARTFLIAWLFFLVSVMIFVLRNFGLLPYNNFTYYALQIGSSIEAVLLSLALGDKINIYRKNQSEARKEALRVAKENERLIKEQNVILEKEVQNRTEQLQHTNEELKGAMKKLQDAQIKLVETEKMASLGQLTAGIAHEINNPINFVTSNIRPLEDDVADLGKVIKMYEELDLAKEIKPQIEQIDQFKEDIDFNYVNEEIATLLSGIREGASRTSEIVKGLRSFARVDEANWKKVDINDGINSTLLLVKNLFPKDFELVKDLAAIPKIECAPGSINQVFMNIITNGIQAIKEKQQAAPMMGRLEITTVEDRGYIVISIKDNGPGIPESVKKKIFEPFFTTKDVGEGTGLGLSIVQGIIEEHNGLIRVDTEPGQGTTFVISLPVR
ncbi:MAG: GHKL domain-containing protein [Niabella sp.]|nr:GHKL domain-containing protein [Niabella sp.]